MYMDNVSALFRKMLEEGTTPDTRTLNVLIKGYAQSLHLNDALRVFHQMRPLYGCEPAVPALRAGERGGHPRPPVGRGLTSPQDYYV
jgi:pentatricopeptide repeat protein